MEPKKYIKNTSKENEVNFEEIKEAVYQAIQSEIEALNRSYPPNANYSLSSKGEIQRDYSLYVGCGGNLYLYWNLHRHSGNYEAQMLASLEATKNLPKKDLDPPSFFVGKCGIHTLEAVITKNEHSVERVLAAQNLVHHPKAQDELLNGNAGYLYCLLFLLKHYPEYPQKSRIVDLVHLVAQELVQRGNRNGVLKYSFPRGGGRYLGAAHGTIGVLHVLLQAHSVLGNVYDEILTSTLSFILSQQFASGNFPVLEGLEEDTVVHWCHGGPGAVPMLIEAYKVFGDRAYLEAAEKAGEDIWTRGLIKKGKGLCHGVAGNAYSFIHLFRITQEEKWLKKAFSFAEKMLRDQELEAEVKGYCDPQRKKTGVPDTPFSLMEGKAGEVCFYSDLVHWQSALFPGYDI